MDIIRQAAWRVPPRQRRPVETTTHRKERTRRQSNFSLFILWLFLSDTDKSSKFVIADSRRSGRERARGAYASFSNRLSRELILARPRGPKSTQLWLKTDLSRFRAFFFVNRDLFLTAILTLGI